VSYLLIHLVLACSRLLAGSWCSWHGKNITIGAGVPVAKAQQPCGRCSRTANIESTTNRVYPHSPKDQEQPLVSSKLLGDEAQVEARGNSFGDTANLDER
jgi:hypothetical protein